MLMLVIYMLAGGAIAGLLSGLLGIGGGIILVPVMIWSFSASGFPVNSIIHMSVATSLATIIPTSISSALAHQRIGSLSLPDVQTIAPFMFAGALLGSLVASQLTGLHIKLAFAIYLIIVAIRMWVQNTRGQMEHRSSNLIMAIAGTVIGCISSILGIGGGTLSVPFLTFYGYPMRKAVAISAACGIPIAIAGSLGYVFLANKHTALPAYSLGYIYTPAFLAVILASIITAPIGANLSKQLPVRLFKRLFAFIVFGVGIKLLL